MQTLHLNLKKKWFDMILSNQKKEEYREIKPYWKERLSHLFPQEFKGETYYPMVDTITFSNGFAKKRPQIIVEFKGISKGKGNVNWGAEANKEYFVLKLGKVIMGKNIIY